MSKSDQQPPQQEDQPADTRPSAMIVVPNGGAIHKTVIASVLRLLADQRVRSTLIMPSGKDIAANWNAAVGQFMRSDYEWFVKIDPDNPCTANVFDLVVDAVAPVVGCPTPTWNYRADHLAPFTWNAYDRQGTTKSMEGRDVLVEHTPCEGLQEVYALGGGLLVIDRAVFKQLQVVPFASFYFEDGTIFLDTDLAFSARCRRAGIKLHAHYDYLCHHHNTCDLYLLAKCYEHLQERLAGAEARLAAYEE